MKKLSIEERAVYGTCPVCNAGPGEKCDTSKEAGPVDYGAHRRRLQLAPSSVIESEVPPQGEPTTSGKFYLALLERVKAGGPDWPLNVRHDLMMATAFYMQSAFMSGVPYGALGFPNMQSLLEIGGQLAEELEAGRAGLVEFIDGTLIPFFRDGTLPLPAADIQMPIESSVAFEGGKAFAEIYKGISAKDELSHEELEFMSVMNYGQELAHKWSADFIRALNGLDDASWPQAKKVRPAVTVLTDLAGLMN